MVVSGTAESAELSSFAALSATLSSLEGVEVLVGAFVSGLNGSENWNDVAIVDCGRRCDVCVVSGVISDRSKESVVWVGHFAWLGIEGRVLILERYVPHNTPFDDIRC